LLRISLPSIAQTIFTYGNQAVSKDEFLKAYNKNNSSGKPTAKAYKDYLDLYSKYKLKVQAAYDERLDTMPTLAVELQNFRTQIANTYMNDQTYTDKLVNEAFERGQKDLHLEQIFISVPQGAVAADTMKAFQKLKAVTDGLKKGQKFETLAETFSDDPFAKTNHGDIGWITVFSLPYALESLAYQTPVGKTSAPFRSKNGYHIFKILAERKALGKMRAAQILLIFPLNPTDASREDVRQRADSIYGVLQKNGNFSALALQFSGDNLSYQHGGEMALFGVGKYDEAFEKSAYALTKDGEISKPVKTGFGYHIIKRLGRVPIPAVKSKETLESFRQQVMNDSRIEIARKAMTKKVFQLTGFREYPFNENELWVLTDSSLQNKKTPKPGSLNDSTVLFSFSKKKYTVRDWINYRIATRNLTALNQNKSNRAIFDQFEESSGTEYYRNHLEEYNKEFAYQLKEFKDGNLLFEIMQRQVWDKAGSDSMGLKGFYESHKDKYWWEPSVDAILVTCTNEPTADQMKNAIRKNIGSWRRLQDSSNGMAQADSARFELIQLPPAEQGALQEGNFTSMSKNANDNSVVFAYIIKKYPNRMPRNFEQARGLVINDYQIYLEDQWLTELKKKYPVKVNEPALQSLSR
jgi:peptidyl-prolyl cis-trans isomerase SurA